MALTSDMINLVLAEEAIEELKINKADMTVDDFHRIVEAVFGKISLLKRDRGGKFSKNEMAQDNDQLQNFFLGKLIYNINNP